MIVLVLAALACAGCNNFFHELIPPDGNRIESFYIPGQLGAAIGDTSIIVTVPPGMALSRLVPSIQVSPGATLFPVTYEYAARTFGDERIFGVAMELYTSGTNTEKVMELIRTHKDNFAVPALDMPINFGYPVDFLVISGLGTMRRYTVRIEVDTGEGKFISFGFDKFFNPEVVRTATGVVDTANKTVTVNVSYPVENIASYQLTPSFETNGARVYMDNGTELTSGASLMDFLKPPDSSDLNNLLYGTQTKTLTLKRAGYADSVWTLTVNFSEDPDTNRSIIDFRFTRARNPLINADYMAEIVNSGDTGTITVTVYYQGARPEELRADFVSPGTVTVQGAVQTSGYNAHDFSAPLQYRVTSRVWNFIRDYTVTVHILPISDPLPQITYFGFSTARNPQLLSDSSAMIDHGNRLILIEAAYNGDTPPVNLIPDFSATGTVTVNGVTHTSGANNVDFSGPVGYVVANPSNPTLRREYRVEVHFVKNLSSIAEITEFSFYRADNPGLIADVHAAVNQLTGEITATVLFETPGGDRTLVPRWSAQGRVESGGVTQTSGLSGRQFYTPQGYRAVSVDGIIQKNYTVTVKEVNSRIYVRQNAAGRNDGTNWQNAYRNMPGACSDAALFPDDIPKELWIASGTYKPSDTGNRDEYLLLTANTGYIGGFAGHETSKSQRNVAANRVIVSGDLGGGVYSNNLFASGFYFTADAVYGYEFQPINGNLSFENIEFTSAQANGGTHPQVSGAAVRARLVAEFRTSIIGCNFNNLEGLNGAAMFIQGGGLVVVDTVIENIRSGASAVWAFNLFGVTINNIKLQDLTSAVQFSVANSSGRIELSRITGNRISNEVHVFGGSNITLTDSSFDASRTISLGGSNINSSIKISNVVINATSFSVRSAENINLEKVTVENFLGNRLYVSSSGGTVLLSNCNIRNTRDGFNINADSVVINNSLFENCTSSNGQAILLGRNVTIRECTFTHDANLVNPGIPTSNYNSSLLRIDGNATFENCTFNNLRGNMADENYIFSRWYRYSWNPSSTASGGELWSASEPPTLTLRNCTFNFNAGSAGLLALYGGQQGNNITHIEPDYLLMDGVTINNNGGQQPLIWLYNSTGATPGTFRFRANNVYNGTTLNTVMAITSLGGVIRLQNGAVPTMVP